MRVLYTKKMCVMQGTTKEIGGCAIYKKSLFLVCCTCILCKCKKIES